MGKVCRSPDTGLPLSASLCNYVASEAVPCVFLAAPRLQRHITADVTEEIKLDGYRALGNKSNGSVRRLSRRNNSFNRQYPLVAEALAELPEDTIVDGEIVALDASGFPNFNLLHDL